MVLLPKDAFLFEFFFFSRKPTARKKGCQSLGLCPPATTWAPTSWDCSKTCVELVDVVKGIPASNGQYLGWSSFAHGRVCNQLAVTKPRRGMARRKACLTEKTVWEVVPTSLRVGAHIVLCFLRGLTRRPLPELSRRTGTHCARYRWASKLGKIQTPRKAPQHTNTEQKQSKRRTEDDAPAETQSTHSAMRESRARSPRTKTRPQRARHCIGNLEAQHQSWSWRLERKCSQTSRRVRTFFITA